MGTFTAGRYRQFRNMNLGGERAPWTMVFWLAVLLISACGSSDQPVELDNAPVISELASMDSHNIRISIATSATEGSAFLSLTMVNQSDDNIEVDPDGIKGLANLAAEYVAEYVAEYGEQEGWSEFRIASELELLFVHSGIDTRFNARHFPSEARMQMSPNDTRTVYWVLKYITTELEDSTAKSMLNGFDVNPTLLEDYRAFFNNPQLGPNDMVGVLLAEELAEYLLLRHMFLSDPDNYQDRLEDGKLGGFADNFSEDLIRRMIEEKLANGPSSPKPIVLDENVDAEEILKVLTSRGITREKARQWLSQQGV